VRTSLVEFIVAVTTIGVLGLIVALTRSRLAGPAIAVVLGGPAVRTRGL